MKTVFGVLNLILLFLVFSLNSNKISADSQMNFQSFWKYSSENLNYTPNFKDFHYLNRNLLEKEINKELTIQDYVKLSSIQ